MRIYFETNFYSDQANAPEFYVVLSEISLVAKIAWIQAVAKGGDTKKENLYWPSHLIMSIFQKKHLKLLQNYEQQKHVLGCGGRVGALAFGNCPSGWRYDFRNAIFLARIVSGESESSCDGRGGDGRSERSRNKSPIVSKGAPGACPAIACTPKHNPQYKPCKG